MDTSLDEIQCLQEEEAMANPRLVLITFDVDGTLIRSIGDKANHLHKRAFAHAFLEVFGISGNCDVLPCHGKTDQMIILDSLEYYGIPRPRVQAKMKEVMVSMVNYFRENRRDIGKGLELLPGVRNLLETLSSHPDVVFGLVTGNLVEIGWMKMEGLGVRHLFTRPNFGGFGSDHWNRGELVNLAARRASKSFPGGFKLRAHVGDTPADVRAAHFGQALAIGVCTGVFSNNDLESSGRECRAIPPFPTIVFPNLANNNNFLCAVGLCAFKQNQTQICPNF
ncbi:hypothetical protein KC19_VG046800 [Ceratodon purpureus]|uniref:Haloacid dehalogenase-like hydrolase n=1 Tax=Ceratodon purpureus TaxID=3225 RepID=A0A8T0HMA2_CERPU|nr:hypothetical protein KC19_VG046800 [Ceratodon purpureus]